ncbi:MAG: DUF1622 domain-containing protein [Anaerolineae bacterium]|nr:DUF1622 domain-containing protein [Anaerolineae bacterium]
MEGALATVHHLFDSLCRGLWGFGHHPGGIAGDRPLSWRLFPSQPGQVVSLRIRLGQSMVMGLEFQVAADILKTGLSPKWEDILFLAALIGLRTILNYFLERELRALNSSR